MDTFVVSVCPLDPDSSDFGNVCALYAPFLHQLTMQSSLFERGCPVLVVVCVARKLRPCPSYNRRRDHINLGLWRSLYKGGGRRGNVCEPDCLPQALEPVKLGMGGCGPQFFAIYHNFTTIFLLLIF